MRALSVVFTVALFVVGMLAPVEAGDTRMKVFHGDGHIDQYVDA